MRTFLASLLALAFLGCHEGVRSIRMEDGAAEAIHGPPVDRCTHAPVAERDRCDQMKADARKYIAGLNVNDNVCLEGGFGDDPGPSCKARGRIADGNNQGFLFTVYDPASGSHWQSYADRKVWVDNEALVDQYLVDRGYQ